MKTITIKKITEQKLEKYLNLIGWGLRGNELNRVIVNDEGKSTVFYLCYDRIELRTRPDAFGDSFKGSFQLGYSDMWIQYYQGKTMEDTFMSLVIPVWSEEKDPGGYTAKGTHTFLSFYPTKLRDQERSKNNSNEKSKQE